MASPFKRLANFASQIVFSIVTPPLLIPKIAKLRITRSFIAFCFGRAYGSHYQSIIDSIQEVYASPMARGLAKAVEIAGDRVSVVVDCGTGTGFVTRQAAGVFPHAAFVAFDILPNMLRQARENCKDLGTEIFHVQADAFALPLADQSVDLLLVQNTMPCFSEFARVCRPGGIVLYVDTAAGWIAGLAKKLIQKNGLFERVAGERVDLGFYVLAQKAGSGHGSDIRPLDRKNRQEKLEALLRCPQDKSPIAIEQDRVICRHRHCFPVRDGFPVMISK